MIFGDQFCVGIYDRAGAQFSSYQNLWDNALSPSGGKLVSLDFIRVVRSLTCDMSLVELGQDPTVKRLSGKELLKWQEIIHPGHSNEKSMPIFRVGMGKGPHCWYTIGPPLWSSVSLLGRGTVVWKVIDSLTRKIFVLKNTWHHGERQSEADIYRAIKGSHPGLAELESGADVVFPDAPERTITVANTRDPNASSEESSPVLHRLVLKTVGRPLWEAKTELELLQGICAALEGKLHCLLRCAS